jgi:polyphosphate kinase
VRQQIREMLEVQACCYREQLLPALAAHGIHIVGWDRLTPPQQYELERYFDSHISPALTPLGFDPAHPFPFISNQSTNWGFVLRDPVAGNHGGSRESDDAAAMAGPRVDVESGTRCCGIGDLLLGALSRLEIVGGTLFRIIATQSSSTRTKATRCVMWSAGAAGVAPTRGGSTSANPDPTIRGALLDKLQLSDADFTNRPAMLDYTTLFGSPRSYAGSA